MLGIGTLLALILWVILGGFISYYGDIQGSRWGKKRVSWFGLRPKHTARLITSLTGAAISLLSIVSLLAIMPAMRQIVLHGEATLNEAHKSKQELYTLGKQIKTDTGKIDDLQTQQEIVRHQTDLVKNQNVDLLKRRDELQNRVAADAVAVKAKEVKVAELNAEKRKLEGEKRTLEGWNRNAAQSNRDLSDQTIALTRNNEELARTNTDLQDEKRSLGIEQKQLEATNADLKSKNAAAESKFYAANAAYHKILDDNERNQDAQADLRKNIVDLVRQRDDLAHERDNLTSENENLVTEITGTNRGLTQAYLSLRQRKVNVQAGGELARTVIDAHVGPDKVGIELQSLMDEAARNARQLGAGEDRNGRVVLIVSKHVVTAAEVSDVDEPASLAALKENIAGSDLPVVVVAQAINNNVEGERILIELTPRSDVTVFHKGDLIAQGVLNAGDQTDRIVQSILGFLQKDVRDAAIAKGVMPRIDPETGEPEVGMENYGDLFGLMQRVRRLGRTVKIEAFAKTDTKCADSLQIEFRVTRADKSH